MRRADWEIKRLGEVSAINYGHTESASSDPVGPRFLRITDIQNDRVDWDTVPYCRLEGTDLPKYQLANGDIVFARTGATTGKSFLVADPPKAVFASYLIRLRLLDKKLLPEFVSLFFQTGEYWQAIKEGSSGSAQGGFNATKLGALLIPVPPIPEQRRIVGILDESFKGIATAKANAEKNLQNARALFESHLQSIFTERGDGWQTQSLSDVCSLFVDSAHRTPKYQEDGIPALRPRDVVGGTLDLSGAARVSLEECAVQSKRYAPSPGDIVYSRELSYGWGAIVPSSPRVCLSQGMCVFRPAPEIDTAFLLHVLNGPIGREQATHAAVGASHPHINLGDIKAYQIPRPSLREQKQLVKQIDSIAAETDRLASIYQQKLAALDELKKSLLHQAFSGQL
jgi:type I restriction enzyme, S subunit